MERDWRCDIPEQRLVWAQVTSEALKIIEGKWKTIILCQLFAAKVPRGGKSKDAYTAA